MENVIPKYSRPIKSIDDPVNKVEAWDVAIDAFDEKDYKKCVINTINYINPSLLEDVNTEGDFEIIKMQGSAEIHVKVTGDTFSVKAPFLKITPETNRVALLRKVSEVNFSPMTLAQINLKDTALWFEYEMPLSLCQPNKVYDLLREVCVNADEYDDMFINKYKASFYKEPNNKALTPEEQEIVWGHISDVFSDYTNYTQFFREKRWDDFQWDIIVISLLKLSNMPYINGELRSDLIEYISNLFNSNIDFQFRVDKGTNFMKKLVTRSREDIMKDVYHAEQFISLRWRSSEQIIHDRLKGNLEQVQRYEKDESYFNLSYYLQFVLLKLIYDYNLEDNYKKAIEDVLEEVSGLTPNEAAPKLAATYYALKDGKVNSHTKSTAKKGFFSKLFG